MEIAEIKPTIAVADIEKLDVRIGTILRVEDIAGSRKLMKLVVDFGDQERAIVAGIKQEREDPQEIEGLQALFVVNLPAQKMANEAMLSAIGPLERSCDSLSVNA